MQQDDFEIGTQAGKGDIEREETYLGTYRTATMAESRGFRDG